MYFRAIYIGLSFSGWVVEQASALPNQYFISHLDPFQPKFIMKFPSIVLGLAALAASTPVPTGPTIITPTVRSQYYVSTGKISYNTGVGLISKTGGTASDITTLLTFTIPAAAVGKTGVFNFALNNAASTTVSGSAMLDLFSSLQPATASTNTWPPGNQRNIQLGRLQVAKGATATWVPGFPTAGQGFTITAAGTYGYELVGVYDIDLVSFTGANNGIWISYS
jgi:hypothetical protein